MVRKELANEVEDTLTRPVYFIMYWDGSRPHKYPRYHGNLSNGELGCFQTGVWFFEVRPNFLEGRGGYMGQPSLPSTSQKAQKQDKCEYSLSDLAL